MNKFRILSGIIPITPGKIPIITGIFPIISGKLRCQDCSGCLSLRWELCANLPAKVLAVIDTLTDAGSVTCHLVSDNKVIGFGFR